MVVILTTDDVYYHYNNGKYIYFINFLDYSAFDFFGTRMRMQSESTYDTSIFDRLLC